MGRLPEEVARIVQAQTDKSVFGARRRERSARIAERVNHMKRQIAEASSVDRDTSVEAVRGLISEAEAELVFNRVIVHIDMDAYYASVEVRDQPELATKPVAVGTNSMLSTCNYKAREFGVRSGMPGFVGRQLCPSLILLPHNFSKYQQIANEVRQIFRIYCKDFVSGGLDEAYLDLTDHLKERAQSDVASRTLAIQSDVEKFSGCSCATSLNMDDVYCRFCKLIRGKPGETVTFGVSAWSAVEEIRLRILLATRLTSSAGISSNLMLAKICSDMNKPNGQFFMEPNRKAVADFVENLNVGKVPGIGPVSQEELKLFGITTCGELRRNLPDLHLVYGEYQHFGFWLRASMGVGSWVMDHGGPRKSIGVETTFQRTSDLSKLCEILKELCDDAINNQQEELEGLEGRTLNLKLKTASFVVKTRAISCSNKGKGFQSSEELLDAAKRVLEKEQEANGNEELRLLGVRLSTFVDPAMSPSPAAASSSRSVIDLLLNSKSKKPGRENDSDVIIIDDGGPERSAISSGDLGDTFHCPVCNFTLPPMSLQRFNEHIDSCLSRQTVRELRRRSAPSQDDVNTFFKRKK